jgi:mono/diheme cytochrome c family protein
MARRLLIAAFITSAALISGGCGSQSISLSENDPHYDGAVLFSERCGSCHTLSVAGTQGSADSVKDKENVDGPNFDTRTETAKDVAYAIENGGFSGAIMPENIATGREKQQIADFLAKYAGSEVETAKPTGGGQAQDGGGVPGQDGN